jgi:hypothetical protein
MKNKIIGIKKPPLKGGLLINLRSYKKVNSNKTRAKILILFR